MYNCFANKINDYSKNISMNLKHKYWRQAISQCLPYLINV